MNLFGTLLLVLFTGWIDSSTATFCQISSFEQEPIDEYSYSLTCMSDCYIIEIAADITSLSKVNATGSAQLDITLNTKGSHVMTCTAGDVADRGADVINIDEMLVRDTRTLTITRTNECSISSFQADATDLICEVNCTGKVTIVNVEDGSSIATTTVPEGGGVTRASILDNVYQYRCVYTESEVDSSTGIPTTFDTEEVDVCRNTEVSNGGINTVYISQPVTVHCTRTGTSSDEAEVCTYSPVVITARTDTEVLHTVSGTSEMTYTPISQGEVIFECHHENNIDAASSVSVQVEECDGAAGGREYRRCVSATCEELRCDDARVINNDYDDCLTDQVCTGGGCRCPDERPFWNATSDTPGDGVCVAKCAARSLVEGLVVLVLLAAFLTTL